MPTILVAGDAVRDFICRFETTPARGPEGRTREFASTGGDSGAAVADVDAVPTDDRRPRLAVPLPEGERRRGTPGLRGTSGRHDLTGGLPAMRAEVDAFFDAVAAPDRHTPRRAVR